MSGKNMRWIGFVLGFAAMALIAALLISRRDAPPPVEATANDIAEAKRRLMPPPVPPTKQPDSTSHAEELTSSSTRAAWSKAMRELAQQTPAQLVHRAAVSKQPQDVFAAHVLMHQCRKGVSPAMVAHAAPLASEQMKHTISRLQERCSQGGNRQQLDYAAQSWPADAPERKGFEAIKRVDKAGVVTYVLSTGSADFAARLLPPYIDLELLEARGLLPPLTPEAADLEGMGPDFDLPSVSRMRDRFAVSWAVAIWSCTRLGTCAEEAQLDFKCHLQKRCVEDLRDYPSQVLFRNGPLEADGTPSYFWVSRTRWAQIERAVGQLLVDLQ